MVSRQNIWYRCLAARLLSINVKQTSHSHNYQLTSLPGKTSEVYKYVLLTVIELVPEPRSRVRLTRVKILTIVNILPIRYLVDPTLCFTCYTPRLK